MSGVRMIIVAEGDGDQRIDRWLRRLFPHVSQGRIEKMCRKGELRLDGGRVKASTRIEAGQQVRVPPLPDADMKPVQVRPKVSEADAKMIQDCVIYRDDQIISKVDALFGDAQFEASCPGGGCAEAGACAGAVKAGEQS